MTRITDSQREATKSFHLRMAKIFRNVGRIKDAEAAERAAKALDGKE